MNSGLGAGLFRPPGDDRDDDSALTRIGVQQRASGLSCSQEVLVAGLLRMAFEPGRHLATATVFDHRYSRGGSAGSDGSALLIPLRTRRAQRRLRVHGSIPREAGRGSPRRRYPAVNSCAQRTRGRRTALFVEGEPADVAGFRQVAELPEGGLDP